MFGFFWGKIIDTQKYGNTILILDCLQFLRRNSKLYDMDKYVETKMCKQGTFKTLQLIPTIWPFKVAFPAQTIEILGKSSK